MFVEQQRECGLRQQRRVPRHDHDRALGQLNPLIGQLLEGDADGVSGTVLLLLHGEQHIGEGLRQVIGDHVSLMTEDHHNV